MGAKNQTSILDLKKDGKSMGKLIVRCEKLAESSCTDWLNFRLVWDEVESKKTHEHWFVFWFLGQEWSLLKVSENQVWQLVVRSFSNRCNQG